MPTPPASTKDLFHTERRKMAQLISGLVIAGLSGFVTWFFPDHGTWQQWTFLLHTFAGFYLSIVVLPYIWIHFKRTLGIRRPVVVILGTLAVIVTLLLVGSGVHIGVLGQFEKLRWIYDLHILTAFIVLGAIGFHLLAHRFLLPATRRTEKHWFASITYHSFSGMGKGVALSVAAVAALSLIYSAIPEPYSDQAVVQPYALPYGSHPFRPSQTETTTGGFLDIKRTGRSANCGACHEEIARQWRASIHAQASSDKSYQTNINLLAKKQGMEATRYCEGCHAPVALLSGELTKGGRLDTHGHLKEGVSCMGCHGIDKVMHLKGVASYRFDPATDYLFGGRDSFLASKINHYLIQIQPRQHRQDMARPVLRSSQMCATCHAQFMDKEMNKWGWVKMQDEYAAWLQSPYSKQSERAFSQDNETRCQDCHLPLAPMTDPSADKNGMAVSHRSLAANTAIPYITGNKTHLDLTTAFLQSNKVRVSIDKPYREQALRSTKPMMPDIAIKTEAPVYYYLGEQVRLNIVVSNIGVGHEFPGGTLDINEAWLQLRVVDAQNKIVYESGFLDADNNVEPEAHFYRSTAIDRNGHHVWRHDLFNMVGDSYRKVIPAGSADVVNYGFKVPTWAKGPLTASVVVRYRKLNNRYARWALKDPTIKLPIVDMARDSISIPLRIKKEAGA